MSEWKNPRKNPPPEGVVVEATGDDYMGDWIMRLMRKDYKQKPTNTKRYYTDNGKFWRWVYPSGEFAGMSVDAKDVPDSWRELTTNAEVRGASRTAGEASSAEGATSTVLLGNGGN